MTTYCYLNGKIVSAKQAKISIYDIGILRGFGIYEALTTHNGKPFLLDDHLERFRRSAAAVGLNVLESDQDLKDIIEELIKRNGFAETNIKFILTGGTAIGGIDYDPDFPTFYVLAEEFSPLPTHFLTEGSKLITYEHGRQYAEYKTTNYLTAVRVQSLRKEQDALEVLYTCNGAVLECATSNFFIVKDGRLITPKDHVLLGITRKAVISLTKGVFPLEERELKQSELATADEAFLTASFKEVVPVVKIDDQKIGTGAVGPVTQEITRLFTEFTRAY